MKSILVPLSKSFFEEHCRVSGRAARVDDYFGLHTYVHHGEALKALVEKGDELVLVAVRDGQLLLLSRIQSVTYWKRYGFRGGNSPQLIRTIDRDEVSFASGKSLPADRSKWARSLRGPRVLTPESAKQLTAWRDPTIEPAQRKAPKRKKTVSAEKKRPAPTRRRRVATPQFEGHSEPVHAVLAARLAYFGELKPSKAKSRKTLAKHDYVAHDAALQFDTAYGGLVVAGEGHKLDGSELTPDWSFDDTMGWTIGPSACLESGAHGQPRGDQAFLDFYGDVLQLVPVAYGPSDDIYYVDAVGRGYYHDTCYDVAGPHLVAATPAQLFARVVLNGWLLNAPHRVRSKKGHRGAKVAKQLKLAPLDDATGEMEAWWGDGATVVVDRIPMPGEGAIVTSTWAATSDAAVAAKLKKLLR